MKIIYKIFLIAACIIYILQLISCTENSQVPQNNSEITIEFINTVKDLNTGTCSYPAEFAEVSIIAIEQGEEKQIGNITSDKNGVSYFTLNANNNTSVYYFLSTFNNFTLRSRNFSFCQNDTTVHFCFENAIPFEVCCETISDTTINIDKEIIIDNSNSSNEIPITLFHNSCESINVNNINYNGFPLLIDGFISNNILLDENDISIDNNGNLTVLLNIKDILSGLYQGDIIFSLGCTGNNSEITFNISINIVQPECDCLKVNEQNEIIVWNREIVDFGSENIDKYFIMKNNLSCDLSIDNIELLKNGIPVNFGNDNSWQPTSNPINKVFTPGEDIFIDLEFSPVKPGKNIDTLLLHTTVNNKSCEYKLICIGNSCQPSCMIINNQDFNNQILQVNETNRFRANSNCFNINENDINKFNFTLKLKENSCSPERMAINIDTIDNVGINYFNFQQDTLVFLSGQEITFPITFNPPTIEEFNSIFSNGDREKTNTAIDSIFSIKIDFVPQNFCDNNASIQISIKMHNDAYLSPQFTLESYDQYTWNINNEPSDPSYSVFKIDYINNGKPGIINDLSDLLNKPEAINIAQQYGDLYVTVENPDLPSNPPQPTLLPWLGLTKGEGQKYSKIKLLESSVNINNFNDIDYMINLIYQKAMNEANYFDDKLINSPIRYLNQGDVYMIFTDDMNSDYPCEIALIYINQLLIGETNNDAYKRSGIKFQMIYPIILN